MKKDTSPGTFKELFFGVVTVGERGQIVIPAKVRKKYRVTKGDKLLVFSHPFKEGIMLFPLGEMENIMREMVSGLMQIQEELEKRDS